MAYQNWAIQGHPKNYVKVTATPPLPRPPLPRPSPPRPPSTPASTSVTMTICSIVSADRTHIVDDDGEHFELGRIEQDRRRRLGRRRRIRAPPSWRRAQGLSNGRATRRKSVENQSARRRARIPQARDGSAAGENRRRREGSRLRYSAATSSSVGHRFMSTRASNFS
jgi:hypothetical protein